LHDNSGLCVHCGECCADFCSKSSVFIQKARHFATEPQAAPTHGPGTELSKLLKRIGIEPTPTCSCRAKAAQMDAWGCDEASKPERIDEVVAVMRAEAEARGLPFLDIAGRLLVRRAISNARRNA
jgi:hypothetical protein